MFIIIRNDGKYVAMPGSEHSYTKKLEEARTFSTRQAAENERCPENETVKPVSEVLQNSNYFGGGGTYLD